MKNKPQLSLPLLRFKGFEGEWEKRKIEDICSKSKNDLLQNNNFLDAPSIMKKKYDIYNSQEYKLAPMNSIVFIKDGSNAGNFFYNYEGSKIASTCDYIEVNQNSLFVYYFLEGKNNFIINNLLIGETIPHLYKKTLNKCSINMPSLSEQQKIAKFFSLLDKQISLWERKLELYQLFYKYYLDIFLNYKNKKFKLSDFFIIVNGYPFSSLNISKNSQCKLITISNISNKNKFFVNLETCKNISKNEQIDLDYKISKGDLCSTLTGEQGFKTCFSQINDAYLNQRNIKYIQKNNHEYISLEYIYHFLRSKKITSIVNNSSTGTQKNVSYKFIENLEIPLINKKEFFLVNHFDIFIDKLKSKISLIKKMKTHYMNVIFC